MVVGQGGNLLTESQRTDINNYFNGIESNWDEYIFKAVNDMINAGIDYISDGQIRDPFINLILRKIKGCRIRDRPEIVNKIEYLKPIILEDIIKVNVEVF